MADVDDGPTRAGFIALIGAPNAGKSTLMNRLVGAKVSIVTPKVQTTRTRITGVAMAGRAQLVFVDTPGIFTPRRRLDKAMVAAAWGGAADADVVVLLVDAARRSTEESDAIVQALKAAGTKAILVLNKVDIVRREKLLGLAARFNESGVFTDTFMISAATGDGVDDLKAALAERMPEGPWLYPEDQLSDMNDRLFAAELTREQLFIQLHEELPYALTVETDTWERFRNGSLKIEQTVYVERDSQRAIVLGKGGSRIRAVGEAARSELEALFGHKVHLYIYVKVRGRWGEDPERYRAMGLDYTD